MPFKNKGQKKEYLKIYYSIPENKEHKKQKDKEYYQKHKKERREYSQKYRENHKEEKKEKDRQYYLLHKEEHNKKAKEWRLKNKEKKKKDDKEYRENHKEESKIYQKEYRKEHKKENQEYHKKYGPIYRKNHKDKINEHTNFRRRSLELIDHIVKKDLLEMFDYICPYCNEELKNDKTAHIDHILPVNRYKAIGKKCPHGYNNCAPAHASCNHKKHDKTPLEYFWSMK
jgi:DNA mismatch repair ATPase MutL